MAAPAVMMKLYQSPAVRHATSSVVVTLKPYNTVYDFYFDTTFVSNANHNGIHFADFDLTTALYESSPVIHDGMLSADNDTVSSTAVKKISNDTNKHILTIYESSAVMMNTTSYPSNNNQPSDNNNNNNCDYFTRTDDNDFDLCFETVFDAPSSNSNDNGNNSFGCTDDAMISATDMMTTCTEVYSSPSSSSFESSNDEKFSAVANAVTRTTQPYTSPSLEQLPSLSYNTMSSTVQAIAAVTSEIYDLHFDTVIAIIVAVAPAVAVGAPSVIKMKTYATIFINLSCLHIIDQGSVLYLTLQILLYNQHYVYDVGNNDSVSSFTVTSVVTIKIISYKIYVAAHSVVTEAFHELLSAIHDEKIPAFTIMTTVFDGRTGYNNGISSATIADKAQYDYYDGDTGNKSLATVTLRT